MLQFSKKLPFPDSVEVITMTRNKKNYLTLFSKKGCFLYALPKGLKASIKKNYFHFITPRGTGYASLLQTYRKIILNNIQGIVDEHVAHLVIRGTNYRFLIKEKELIIKSEFSHLLRYKTPLGVVIVKKKNTETEFFLKSVDLQKLNEFAGVLRHFKKKDPYKGVGIFYAQERPSLKKSKKDSD